MIGGRCVRNDRLSRVGDAQTADGQPVKLSAITMIFVVCSAVGLFGVYLGIQAANRWPRYPDLAPVANSLRAEIVKLKERIDYEPPKPKKRSVARAVGPRKNIPGAWNNCQVCGRPLTDPTSRYRGVGPTCFARTRRYFPEGPRNPEYEAQLAEAERAYREKNAPAEAQHREAVLKWEVERASWPTSRERRDLASQLQQSTVALQGLEIEQAFLRQRCLQERERVWS